MAPLSDDNPLKEVNSSKGSWAVPRCSPANPKLGIDRQLWNSNMNCSGNHSESSFKSFMSLIIINILSICHWNKIAFHYWLSTRGQTMICDWLGGQWFVTDWEGSDLWLTGRAGSDLWLTGKAVFCDWLGGHAVICDWCGTQSMPRHKDCFVTDWEGKQWFVTDWEGKQWFATDMEPRVCQDTKTMICDWPGGQMVICVWLEVGLGG